LCSLFSRAAYCIKLWKHLGEITREEVTINEGITEIMTVGTIDMIEIMVNITEMNDIEMIRAITKENSTIRDPGLVIIRKIVEII
jgi:hypothetical protein